ncbi:hypothetical protein EXE58_04355 [Nocardioides seonyuensis]|uniref:Uncharacterized protein n=1 Tax=Nocardioides seonyuensis TaxID=2518371 RepID=A0A4P7IGC0_9ACTN|nr:hypothetical protein [Nocardioides seonyuensis]QBX54771.1 hypothetical protein EXE58_04355 [Nocardioides seonyuensis]
MMTRRTLHPLVVGVLPWALVLGLAGCSSDPEVEGDGAPASSSPSEIMTTSSETLELTVEPPPGQPKCMVPNVEALSTQDTAFEGTVTEVADGVATLSVQEWYSEDAGPETVSVSTPSEQLQDLLVAVDFQEGRTYLVSSLDGRVSLCGFTAESNPRLEALYAAAFVG